MRQSAICAPTRSYTDILCSLLHTIDAGNTIGSTTRRVSDTGATSAIDKPLHGAAKSVRGTDNTGPEPIQRHTGANANLRRPGPHLHGATSLQRARTHWSVYVSASFPATIYFCPCANIFARCGRAAARVRSLYQWRFHYTSASHRSAVWLHAAASRAVFATARAAVSTGPL